MAGQWRCLGPVLDVRNAWWRRDSGQVAGELHNNTHICGEKAVTPMLFKQVLLEPKH